MQRRNFLRQLLAAGSGLAAVSTTGCGTILHQERIHQPHSRDIDWKIAGLNGLGLALFFVPGVVAFVVDFYSGAIYLPPKGGPGYAAATEDDRKVVAVVEGGGISEDWQRETLPHDELQPDRIEQVLATHLNTPVSLDRAGTRVSELAGWNQFRHQLHRHEHDAEFGVAPKTFFKRIFSVKA